MFGHFFRGIFSHRPDTKFSPAAKAPTVRDELVATMRAQDPHQYILDALNEAKREEQETIARNIAASATLRAEGEWATNFLVAQGFPVDSIEVCVQNGRLDSVICPVVVLQVRMPDNNEKRQLVIQPGFVSYAKGLANLVTELDRRKALAEKVRAAEVGAPS